MVEYRKKGMTRQKGREGTVNEDRKEKKQEEGRQKECKEDMMEGRRKTTYNGRKEESDIGR
jgi:hypothetical protein